MIKFLYFYIEFQSFFYLKTKFKYQFNILDFENGMQYIFR